MLYLDTSALVPLYVLEVRSAAVRAFMRGVPANIDIVVSTWAHAEFISAIHLKERTGQVRGIDTAKIIADFNADITTDYRMVAVDNADCFRAGGLISSAGTPLRAGDALHLAIAQRLGAQIATIDGEMHAAALALGIAAPVI